MKASPFRLLALLLAAGLVAFVLVGRIPSNARWALILGNSAHGPVFAVVAAVILGLRGAFARCGLKQCLTAFVLALGLGVAVEIVQSFIGRDAELKDVVTDALGAAAGIFIFVAYAELRRTPRSKPRIVYALLAFSIATLVVAAPLLQAGAAYIAKDIRFPTLVDANAPLGMYFVTAYDGITAEVAPLPIDLGSDENTKLGLRVRPGSLFPWGLGLSEMVADWRAKSFVVIQLANAADTPLKLQTRIYDVHHADNRRFGYYLPIEVPPYGVSTQRIPLAMLGAADGEHHVDLSAVTGIVFYGMRADDARDFYLMKVWLE